MGRRFFSQSSFHSFFDGIAGYGCAGNGVDFVNFLYCFPFELPKEFYSFFPIRIVVTGFCSIVCNGHDGTCLFVVCHCHFGVISKTANLSTAFRFFCFFFFGCRLFSQSSFHSVFDGIAGYGCAGNGVDFINFFCCFPFELPKEFHGFFPIRIVVARFCSVVCNGHDGTCLFVVCHCHFGVISKTANLSTAFRFFCFFFFGCRLFSQSSFHSVFDGIAGYGCAGNGVDFINFFCCFPFELPKEFHGFFPIRIVVARFCSVVCNGHDGTCLFVVCHCHFGIISKIADFGTAFRRCIRIICCFLESKIHLQIATFRVIFSILREVDFQRFFIIILPSLIELVFDGFSLFIIYFDLECFPIPVFIIFRQFNICFGHTALISSPFLQIYGNGFQQCILFTV